MFPNRNTACPEKRLNMPRYAWIPVRLLPVSQTDLSLQLKLSCLGFTDMAIFQEETGNGLSMSLSHTHTHTYTHTHTHTHTQPEGWSTQHYSKEYLVFAAKETTLSFREWRSLVWQENLGELSQGIYALEGLLKNNNNKNSLFFTSHSACSDLNFPGEEK